MIRLHTLYMNECDANCIYFLVFLFSLSYFNTNFPK
jgi:hypothetical protein